jgi:terminal uridylyltransferase
MDLCCLIDSAERLAATDLVTMLGNLLERGQSWAIVFLQLGAHSDSFPETKFHVKPLPHARIPIVKLSLDPSPGLPLGIACDIGFENRLALENTRLLMCYAMIDPTRVRTMVLFRELYRSGNITSVADHHLICCLNKSKSGARGGESQYLFSNCCLSI